MVQIIDPLSALKADRAAQPSASQIAVGRAPEPLDGEVLPPASKMAAMKKDFRVFYTVLLRHLMNRDPTPLQMDIAYWLQHSPARSGIMAFRGASKSWLTGGYALWRLFCDPQLKILIVSGGQARATATANWCLMLILTMPELAFLRPSSRQRASSQAFDVGPALPDQSPSFNAAGIGGQLVGFRGDLIVGDDVETQTNSLTVTMREKIRDAVKEFDSVLKPGGEIKYLGTPHDEDSLYNHLPEVAFRIWPGRYPTPAQASVYIVRNEGKLSEDRLAPFIKFNLSKDPGLIGHSVEPSRFTDEDLAAREASMGASEFTLQFMLDTTLATRDKYPLKLRDLIVLDLDPLRAPEEIIWGSSNAHSDLPLMGFIGDRFYKPMRVGDYFLPYTSISAFVDPSGRGGDETSMTIVGYLHGYIFLLWQGAWTSGATPETLKAIADACVRWWVMKLEVEDNFGDGMFTSLLKPYIITAWEEATQLAKDSGVYDKQKSYGTSIEEMTSSNQMHKEKRILSVLEPITQQHRLVVNREVIVADLRSIEKRDGEESARQFSLFYQYSHLTRLKDSLKRDDRIEGLGGACRRYAALLGVNPGLMASRARTTRQEDDLAKMLMGDLMLGETAAAKKPGGSRVEMAKAQSR